MSNKRVTFDETITIQEFNDDEPVTEIKRGYTDTGFSYKKFINILFMILCIMLIILILLC